MKISVFFYSALAFVIISGVMFGLDWQPATLSPMAPIQVVALPLPPPPPAPIVAPKPVVAAPLPAAPPPAAPAIVAAPKPIAPTPPKALCDIAACAAAYRSFRESDCTFNPSFGPRQLCTKGVVPTAAATPAPPAAPASSDAPASIMQDEPGRQTPPAAQPTTASDIKCNVGACVTAYRTFTASDCTFMASGGVRRLCTK